MFLLDTNVLFAAIYQAHIHHAQVSRWLTAEERYATCGLTQIGAFRLLIMPKAMHDSPLDPITAHEVLSDFSNSERHAFLACPAPSASFVGQTSGHKAAFDDYFVQIASHAGYKVATLDSGLTNRWPAHTLLIGPSANADT